MRPPAPRHPDTRPPVGPGRRPALRLPAGATDCHAHLFGSQARYPLLPDTHFVPHELPWDRYAAVLRSIGCTRAVLVQPSVYGTDNRAIEHALQAAMDVRAGAGLGLAAGAGVGDHADSDMALRAVAVVAPDVPDKELERLHGLGFRGLRINIAAGTCGLRLEHARPLAERIRGLGWHLQFHADFHQNPAVGDVLAALPVPIVIDHFGRVPTRSGVASPGFKALLRLLARETCWVKLSAPYFLSTAFAQDTHLAPLAQALFAAAPDRVVWGTDWPHVSAREQMPVDADLVDLLAQWLPNEAAIRRVLVDNPARLYGFSHTSDSGDSSCPSRTSL